MSAKQQPPEDYTLDPKAEDRAVLPCQDHDAEAATLGSILLLDAAYEKAFAICQPSDFYYEAHRMIAEAMVACHQRNEPAEMIEVSAELRRRKQLEQAGGGEYITALIDSMPTAAHVAHYAAIVAEHSIRRQVRSLAVTIHAEAAHPHRATDLGTWLAAKANQFDALRDSRVGSGLKSVQDEFGSYINMVEARLAAPTGHTWQATGIEELDRHLWGIGNERLLTIKAKTKQGKSKLLRQIIRTSARRCRDQGRDDQIIVYCLEEAPPAYVSKFIAGLKGIDTAAFLPGRWAAYERRDPIISEKKIEAYAEFATFAGLHFKMEQHITIGQIEEQVRAANRQKPVGLVVVDYFGLLKPDTGRNGVEELKDMAERLQGLADYIAGPVVAASQVTYNPDTHELITKGGTHLQDNSSLVLTYMRKEGDDGTAAPEGELIFDYARNVELRAAIHVNALLGIEQFLDDEQFATFETRRRHGGVRLDDVPAQSPEPPGEEENIFAEDDAPDQRF
jgi:replicative DNA helicase